MPDNWNDDQPIYKQIRDQVVSLIIDNVFSEGDVLPSVRQVSSEKKVNHLTVSKAYQELVDEDILEMKRGRGMFVKSGAKNKLLAFEKQRFIDIDLPKLVAKMTNLGINRQELIDLIDNEEKQQ